MGSLFLSMKCMEKSHCLHWGWVPASDQACPRNLQMSQMVLTDYCYFFSDVLWKRFLRENLHFFKKWKYPSNTKTTENSYFSTAKLSVLSSHNHAPAQHITWGLLWCLIYSAAHICTWCASHVSNVAVTSNTKMKFRSCLKHLWSITPYVSSQEFNPSEY